MKKIKTVQLGSKLHELVLLKSYPNRKVLYNKVAIVTKHKILFWPVCIFHTIQMPQFIPSFQLE